MEKIEELDILGAIQTNMASSIQAGFNPKIVLIHPALYGRLIQQLDAKRYFPNNSFETILGLKCHVTTLVKDFVIVDDRSWVHQKF